VVENERSTGQWAKVKYAYHDGSRYGIDARQDYPGSGEDVGFVDPGNRDAVGEGGSRRVCRERTTAARGIGGFARTTWSARGGLTRWIVASR
jgi:hypothetical protein